MNLLIPMAWLWSRFKKEWVDTPKPFIDVDWKTMIEKAIETLDINGRVILIISQKQMDVYPKWKDIIRQIKKEIWDIITIYSNEQLKWAATTCLEAEEYIDNEDSLLIANCDQIMHWNWKEFEQEVEENWLDWNIITYTSSEPKNSYAQCDKNWLVTKVAEKQVISDIATIWLYHWQRWKYFVDWVRKMVQQKETYNWEYYVAPVYNQNIQDWLKIWIYPIDNEKFNLVWTPKDLSEYLQENH